MALLNLGSPNCTVHLSLLSIWNCLRDNNYVVLFYRIHLSRQPELSKLGISGNIMSADKSSLQGQDKQQISFFVGFRICPTVTEALQDSHVICDNYFS